MRDVAVAVFIGEMVRTVLPLAFTFAVAGVCQSWLLRFLGFGLLWRGILAFVLIFVKGF